MLRKSLALALLLSLGALAGRAAADHRHAPPPPPPPPQPRIDARTLLTPPADAANQEADGAIELLESKGRSAIHVNVHHLERGITYPVNITKGDKTELLGNITIPPKKPKPPHCFTADLAAVTGVTTDATGLATFHLDDDDLHYEIKTTGLSGPVTAASIVLASTGDKVYDLDPKKLHGTIDVTATDIAHLIAGEYSVVVDTEKNPKGEIGGKIAACPPKPPDHDEENEENPDDTLGNGKLNIDTKHGDKLPLGAASVADLVGSSVKVSNDKGAVVLQGDIVDLKKHHRGEGAHCFTASLDGAQETPPVTTDATGTAHFNLAFDDLHYEVKVSGLSGKVTAAHIHVGAPGVKGPVVYPLDITDLRGTLEVTPADVAALRAGNYYVNVHTEKNPDGEIRGQILACPPKPPPAAPVFGGGESFDSSFQSSNPAFDAMVFNVLGKHDASFVRGDANMDGLVDVSDSVACLSILFQAGAMPFCEDAADANDDGHVDISDAISTLNMLFNGAAGLPPPGSAGVAGFDSTPDELLCGTD